MLSWRINTQFRVTNDKINIILPSSKYKWVYMYMKCREKCGSWEIPPCTQSPSNEMYSPFLAWITSSWDDNPYIDHPESSRGVIIVPGRCFHCLGFPDIIAWRLFIESLGTGTSVCGTWHTVEPSSGSLWPGMFSLHEYRISCWPKIQLTWSLVKCPLLLLLV